MAAAENSSTNGKKTIKQKNILFKKQYAINKTVNFHKTRLNDILKLKLKLIQHDKSEYILE